MGGKSSTTSGPSKAALPQINAATTALGSAFQQSQPFVQQGTQALSGALPQVLGQTLNNPTLAAANSYTQDVLGGKYMNDPYLDQMIADTNSSVANGVNGAIGTRGLTGGSAQQQILARELAKNETGLRYADRSQQLGRMDNAVGAATSLSSAGNQNIAALLAYLNGGASLPMNAAGQYAQGIGGLWGNSQTTTQKNNPGLLGVLGAGLQTAAMFSDRRLKQDIRRVGTRDDGLGVYDYRYIWGGPVHRGVMADEVAALRPDALAEPLHGFARVDYGVLA